MKQKMDEAKRLELITEAVRYCQRVKAMGMPSNCFTKTLREPIYFLWDRRACGDKDRIARFRSRSSLGVMRGTGRLVFDHAVPFKYLQHELLKLADVSPATVGEVLKKNATFVLITKEENTVLNRQRFRSQMPDGWDGIDPMARYKAADIEIIDNPNYFTSDV